MDLDKSISQLADSSKPPFPKKSSTTDFRKKIAHRLTLYLEVK